ncbi:hypothetical protein ACROYT_G017479 [Oculina patagonica]
MKENCDVALCVRPYMKSVDCPRHLVYLRNVAMGTSTAWARVSAFASAYAPLLLDVHRFLPFGIMAGLALGAAVLCMTLPETYNQPTKENLSQDPEDPGYDKDENRNPKDSGDEDTSL